MCANYPSNTTFLSHLYNLHNNFCTPSIFRLTNKLYRLHISSSFRSKTAWCNVGSRSLLARRSHVHKLCTVFVSFLSFSEHSCRHLVTYSSVLTSSDHRQCPCWPERMMQSASKSMYHPSRYMRPQNAFKPIHPSIRPTFMC